MSSLTISVALCTHNGATYVREQVESILRQTVPASEIVLSDDASTDDTVAIVEATVADWLDPKPELVVIRNATALGVVANFEQAVLACTGDLIALSDQDDVWRRDKLEVVEPVFEAHPALLLVHSDATLVDGDLNPLRHSLLESLEATTKERRELVDGQSFRTFLRRNLVTGATVVFRRELLEKAVPFSPRWIHDEWLAIIAACLDSTLLIDDELIDYRQHGKNQIGAEKPTFAYKLGKLVEPRGERNLHLVERAEDLLERVELLQPAVSPDRVELARRNLLHQRRRQAVPRTRVLRIPAVAAGLLSGRYSTFSRGLIDVARDLVQPAR
ncbi:MAG: glycosyltransferase family 2 protein [Salinibacterium sp.]|nr:glycosyltransferase family 2 protein [Salinibacterium sp.]